MDDLVITAETLMVALPNVIADSADLKLLLTLTKEMAATTNYYLNELCGLRLLEGCAETAGTLKVTYFQKRLNEQTYERQ